MRLNINIAKREKSKNWDEGDAHLSYVFRFFIYSSQMSIVSNVLFCIESYCIQKTIQTMTLAQELSTK